MEVVKEHILKHGLKQDKPYVREVRHTCTGFDIFYGTERQAFRYANYEVALGVSRDLQRHGNFYPMEVED